MDSVKALPFVTSCSTENINKFLLENNLRIRNNPCVSPDFCLDWPALVANLKSGNGIHAHSKSKFHTVSGLWMLAEHVETGDCAWVLQSQEAAAELSNGETVGTLKWWPEDVAHPLHVYPATWDNLLVLKNLSLEHDPESTIFPVARGSLERSSLGVGARFTTLHWPACDWVMAHLGLSVTANQNSIPRELVYDVNEMLDGRLQTCDFKFIGTSVPEGHQGQSVEGMSHGAVLAKLRAGFHALRIPWGFNADHQPIGGKYDQREDALVRGCVLATYITYDLSPELQSQGTIDGARAAEILASIPQGILEKVRARVMQFNYQDMRKDGGKYDAIIAGLWPSMAKMKLRDEKYAAARNALFTTDTGRAYYRELSIDELPGLTSRETLVTVLALCEALAITPQYIAPAFGFQKNFPFDDNEELKRRIGEAWDVCARFGVSIGFHSGSGKSAENYNVCGDITGSNLEIKTSGRYTYEMGRALSRSSHPADQKLWQDWYAFTVSLATTGCFSDNEDEREMARSFVTDTLKAEGAPDPEPFGSPDQLTAALSKLTPSADHMLWFEYNFLFVLAAGGAADKQALGDHSPAGYVQRSRFYSISEEGRLLFAKGVASYIIFLAETTGMVPPNRAARALETLSSYSTYSAFFDAISVPPTDVDATTMTRVTLVQPHEFSVASVPRPRLSPSPKMALVRTRAVGVCGTDFHAYTGDQPFFTYPRVLGHELAVEVVEVADGNSRGLKVGDRCAVLPYLPCHRCLPCRSSRPNCCTSLKVLGVHVDGGMQEYWTVPIAHLFPSATLRFDQLALVETLGIGAHAVARSNVSAGDTLLIVGCGPVGMAAMQFAMTKGCRLIVADVVESRLAFCRDVLGVGLTVNAAEGSLPDRLMAVNGGDLPNVVIDATGHLGSMNNAVNLVSAAGTIVYVGLNKGDLSFADPLFHRKEITMLASRNSCEAEFQSIIKAVEDGKIDTTPWVTHRAPLSEFLENFENWRQPESGVIKAIVDVP